MKTRIAACMAVWWKSQIVLNQKLKLRLLQKSRYDFFKCIVHLRACSYTHTLLPAPYSFCACYPLAKSIMAVYSSY